MAARAARRSTAELVVATVAGAALFAVVAALIARPYFRVADAHPEAKRPPSTVEAFSGRRRSSWSLPTRTWSGAARPRRSATSSRTRSRRRCSPGSLILVLGDRRAALRRAAAPRCGSGSASGVAGHLRPRARLPGGGGAALAVPGRLRASSGMGGIRTPGRLVTFATLALALLAGAGAAAACARRCRRWATGSRPRSRRLAAAALLVLAIAIEGRGLPFDPTDEQAQPRVPPDAPPTSPTSRRRSCTCRPSGGGQPPLPALVDRRLPDDRQRALQHQPESTEELIAAMARLSRPRHRRTDCASRGPQRHPAPGPPAGKPAGRRRGAAGRGAGPEPAEQPAGRCSSTSSSPSAGSARRRAPAPGRCRGPPVRGSSSTRGDGGAGPDSDDEDASDPPSSGVTGSSAIVGPNDRDRDPAEQGAECEREVAGGRPRSCAASPWRRTRSPGDREQHRDDRDPVGLDPEHRQQRVLEPAVEEELDPGAGALLAEQREGERGERP